MLVSLGFRGGLIVRCAVRTLSVIALLLAYGCGSSNSPTAPSSESPTTPSQPTMTALAVNGADSVTVGQTSPFAASAGFSDGTTQNVTNSATWQSSNSAIATVSSDGIVTAVSAGTVIITATYQGESATRTTRVAYAGSPLEPYQYQAFNGSTVTLYAMTGLETALLAPSPDLDVSTLNRIVAAFDGIYGAYQAATGRTPSLNVNFHGLSTVAVVPSTCGAGCGYLGATGIEVMTPFFTVLYQGMRDRNEFDQAVAYEFGRNFWFYSGQLEYKSPTPDSIVTGYAVFMRFISMDRAGLAGGPFNGVPFGTFRSEVEALTDRYVADASRNWNNTLGVAQGVANPMGLGATDLFASFLFKLTRRFGDPFVDRLWQEVGRRPAAATTQDAVDNFILAASAAGNANLTAVFEQTWRWPVSDAAKREAERYGPPTPTL